MEKREPIAEIKEKIDAIIIKDFNQDGASMQYNSSGEVKGRYHAIHSETSEVNFRRDGTLEWQVKAAETTKEGDNIMFTGNGTGLQEPGMTGSIKGQVVAMTNSSRLSWINNLRIDVDGKIDQKNKEISMKYYLAMQQEVSAPAM
ncbi:MAG: hypothetical protein ACQCN5_04270 [Candidatus Bathyarchaeia archaeon]|jgi:hypothetical protein